MKKLIFILTFYLFCQNLNAQAFKVGDAGCISKSINLTFTTNCPGYYTASSHSLAIDVDGDLVDDVVINNFCSDYPANYIYQGMSVSSTTGIQFVESTPSTPYTTLKNLPFGSVISSNTNWVSGGDSYWSGIVASTSLFFGQVTDPFYVGYRKIFPSDTIYGWIHMGSGLPGKVYSYASKSSADTSSAPSPVITNTNTSICLGDSITLTGNPSGGYFYGPGVIGNKFYSSIAGGPGIHKIVYNLNPTPSMMLCNGTASISITVNAPNTMFTGIPYNVCTNSTFTLTGSPTGGVFNGPGVSGNVFNSSITGPGTFSLSYICTDINGCSKTVYSSIQVNPPPAFTNTTTSVCAGTTLALTANSTGGTFSGPGVTGNIFNGAFPGTYTLNYTPPFNSGCPVNTASYSITVQPWLNTLTVNVTSSALPSCPGQSVILTATGANSYTWWPGAINSQTIIFNPTSSQNYYVVGSSSVACTFTNDILFNQIVDQPTVSVSAYTGTVCPGTSTQLFAGGVSTYTWSTGANGSVCNINPTVTTSYSVVGTSTAGCKDTAYINQVVSTPTVSATVASNSICAGTQVTLLATGAANYLWSNGCASAACVNMPTVTTSYSVIGSNYGGCSDTAYINIFVDNSNLILTTSSSNSLLCVGDTATLNLNGSTGGYFVQSLDNSFQISTSSSSVQISPATTTTFVIYGNLLPSGCLATGFFIQNVSSYINLNLNSPAALSCPGQSITLTASGAPTYSWSTGSSSQSIIITPTVSTNYSLTGTNIDGCKKTITYYQAVANPSVNISLTSNTICAGQTTTLSTSGASNYTWSTGATSQFITINPTVTTTYSVVGTNYGGCSDTGYVSQIVIPNATLTAVSNQSVICPGDTAIISLNGGNGYYTVSTNMGGLTLAVSGPTVLVITPTVTTTYSVNTACASPVYLIQNVTSCVGINEMVDKENYLKIFPNPNNGEFEIKGIKEEEIFISNELGQLVGTKILNKENNYSVKLSNLQNGIYFVGNKISRQKVVVIK